MWQWLPALASGLAMCHGERSKLASSTSLEGFVSGRKTSQWSSLDLSMKADRATGLQLARAGRVLTGLIAPFSPPAVQGFHIPVTACFVSLMKVAVSRGFHITLINQFALFAHPTWATPLYLTCISASNIRTEKMIVLGGFPSHPKQRSLYLCRGGMRR